MTTQFQRLTLLALAFTLAACAAPQRTAPPPQSIADPSFLSAYAQTFRFTRGAPRSITPLNDGTILFLQSPARSPEQSLYRFDPRTNKAALIAGSSSNRELTLEEKARLERTRSTARGIRSYAYHHETNSILIPQGNFFTILDLDTNETFTSPDFSAPLIDPQRSPDGSRVAFVRNGNLHVFDLETESERRLTEGANEHVTFGLAEFVAQEEMDRQHGFWWSPDSLHILYQRTDTSMLETFTIADPRDPAKPAQTWPYPRAGTPNAQVTLHLTSVDSAHTSEVIWNRDTYPYLASVRWPKNTNPHILVQNREQTTQRILSVNTQSGDTPVIGAESDAAWLNLDQQMPRFLDEAEQFLWSTERNGAWQLELLNADGSRVGAIFPPTPNYRGICTANESAGQVIYRAANDPRFANLYSAPLHPTGQAPSLLTPNQPGMHDAVFSKDNRTLVHTYTPLHGQTQHFVRHVTDPETNPLGEIVATLPSRTERPSFDLNLSFETIDHPDGPFHAAIIKPRNFSPDRKYPVIVHVYGGPHSQRVYANPRAYYLDQYIADHGFITLWIDGRGTPYRGREWERIIKHNFIDIPLQDQVNALHTLAQSHPEMDMDRVGIWGWSFGGYFSAMAAMRHPGTYHCAVVGAPVCEWEDYDTHYTERYIGTPQANPDAYEVSNVLTYADQLRVPLLIIHGTADDNVFFTHAIKMSDALTRAGIDHEFLPLAGHTHMVAEPEIVEQMYARIIRFFKRNLTE